MSDETKFPSGLELASTEDLVNQLFKRCDVGFVLLHKNTERKDHESSMIRWLGHPVMLMGLLTAEVADFAQMYNDAMNFDSADNKEMEPPGVG